MKVGRVGAGTANRVCTETCLDKDSPVPAGLQRHTDAPRVQLETRIYIHWGCAIQRSYQLFSIVLAEMDRPEKSIPDSMGLAATPRREGGEEEEEKRKRMAAPVVAWSRQPSLPQPCPPWWAAAPGLPRPSATSAAGWGEDCAGAAVPPVLGRRRRRVSCAVASSGSDGRGRER